MQSKAVLRDILKKKRLSLSAAEVSRANAKIYKKLNQTIDWPKYHNLHIYKSVPDWHEIDTEKLIKHLSSNYPKIKVVVPSMNKDAPIPDQSFDLIIVPTLGFDKNNYRLGLGAGWYDKFLATQPSALKIGLAYSWALVDNLPVEEHDIPLDKIITDSIITSHDSKGSQNQSY